MINTTGQEEELWESQVSEGMDTDPSVPLSEGQETQI